MPDRQGNFDNVVVGYGSMNEFLTNEEQYFGAVVGRYANRIAGGRITVDDHTYQLPCNLDGHHLHGGPQGFHQVVWGADQVDAQTLNLSYRSTDGEGGYPGNLGVKVTYELTDHDELRVTYSAESDTQTILNMSHHAYYNLHGTSNGDSVDNHRLTLHADHFTEVDSDLIPTGKIATVADTPLDFRAPKALGEDRKADHPCLNHTEGYDHNFVLRGYGHENPHLAAEIEEPKSGRALQLYTSEPGLQFYYSEHPVSGIESAFCLEPQHFPDSPHHNHFPSTVLDAHETYQWEMILAVHT